MIKIKIVFLALALVFFINTNAQTHGTLTFSFTPTSHGTTNHALVIWLGTGGVFHRTLNLE